MGFGAALQPQPTGVPDLHTASYAGAQSVSAALNTLCPLPRCSWLVFHTAGMSLTCASKVNWYTPEQTWVSSPKMVLICFMQLTDPPNLRSCVYGLACSPAYMTSDLVITLKNKSSPKFRLVHMFWLVSCCYLTLFDMVPAADPPATLTWAREEGPQNTIIQKDNSQIKISEETHAHTTACTGSHQDS